MSNQELFVPGNLLDTCIGLQEVIATAIPDEKDVAGAHAREIIGSDVTYFDENKLEIRTQGAFALPDGLTSESDIWPVVSYGEMRLKGHLAQVAYARVDRIRSLMWMMIDPVIREATPRIVGPLEETPVDLTDDIAIDVMGDQLRRPLYLPVGMIESVFIAG